MRLRVAGLVLLVPVAGCSPFTSDDRPVADPVVATSSPADPQTARPTRIDPSAWVPTQDEVARARALADGLSLEDLAGQLIIARHRSDEESLALVRDRHFAGDMVTGDRILDVTTDDPIAQVRDFNDELRAAGEARGVPTLIPIDQEGGLVARLRGPLTEFGSYMTAGAAITGDPSATSVVEAAAKASGQELRSAGFNAVFAPDADVTIGVADPIIGSRSAGDDPDVVAQAITASVRGYGDAGLISAVKHFPGHNVSTDSHVGLPVLASDRDRLRDHDMVPFRAAIDIDAPAIMTGHLDVPYFDPGVPASMSRTILTDGLRGGLGYEGLIISDSLGMGAVMQRYPGGSAAVEALKAGSDLALMPADNEAAHDAVVAALKSGDFDQEQARASATRVIAHAIHAEAQRSPYAAPGSQSEASTALSAAGITLVSCAPITPITSAVPQGSASAVAAFEQAAAERGFGTTSGPRLFLTGPDAKEGWGDIVVATDRPYRLAYSTAATRIALYGANREAMLALIDVLSGAADAPGQLPVDIGAAAC